MVFIRNITMFCTGVAVSSTLLYPKYIDYQERNEREIQRLLNEHKAVIDTIKDKYAKEK